MGTPARLVMACGLLAVAVTVHGAGPHAEPLGTTRVPAIAAPDQVPRSTVATRPSTLVTDHNAVAIDTTYPDAVVGLDTRRNRYLVVWADGPAGARDIVGVLVYPNHLLASGVFTISVSSIGDDGEPAVAYNEAVDEFMVVWTHTHSDTNTDPHGRRVNAATGALLGTTYIDFSGGVVDLALGPVVAANPLPGAANRWFVAWMGHHNDGAIDHRYVYGALATASGTVATPIRVTGLYSEIHAQRPAVAFAPAANRFLVAYESLGSGDDWNIAVGGVDATAGVNLIVSSTLPQCGLCDDAHYPAIAWNAGTGKALVVWVDLRTTPAEDHCIYGRLLTATNASGNEFEIDHAVQGYENLNPAISAEPTGSWLVLFERPQSSAPTANDQDIAARWVSPTGAATSFSDITTDVTSDSQSGDYEPAVVYNARYAHHYAVYRHRNGYMGPNDVRVVRIGASVYSLTIAHANFDGAGPTDRTVVRVGNDSQALGWYTIKSSGGSTGVNWGTVGDVPVPGDYDGDGRADVAVWRPADGGWYYIRSSTGAGGAVAWGSGAHGDIPVPGDYDGDGKTDVAVYRPGSAGAYYVLNSSTGTSKAISWGTWGDLPVVADFDGDHKVDMALWRPSTGTFFVVPSSGASAYAVAWGQAGDQPLVADFDGDGRDDLAVFRPYENGSSRWYIIKSQTHTSIGVSWGHLGDLPTPADFDGDGKADVAVWRPGSPASAFYIIQSSGGSVGVPWGTAFDLPIVR